MKFKYLSHIENSFKLEKLIYLMILKKVKAANSMYKQAFSICLTNYMLKFSLLLLMRMALRNFPEKVLLLLG